jgi:hypothetical protein
MNNKPIIEQQCRTCKYFSAHPILPCAVHTYLEKECPDFEINQKKVESKKFNEVFDATDLIFQILENSEEHSDYQVIRDLSLISNASLKLVENQFQRLLEENQSKSNLRLLYGGIITLELLILSLRRTIEEYTWIYLRVVGLIGMLALGLMIINEIFIIRDKRQKAIIFSKFIFLLQQAQEAKKTSLMSRLKNIKIDAPELNLYLNGEDNV